MPFLLHFDDFSLSNGSVYHFIDFLPKILFMLPNDLTLRFGSRVFGHEDGAAVFIRLDGGLIGTYFQTDIYDVLGGRRAYPAPPRRLP